MRRFSTHVILLNELSNGSRIWWVRATLSRFSIVKRNYGKEMTEQTVNSSLSTEELLLEIAQAPLPARSQIEVDHAVVAIVRELFPGLLGSRVLPSEAPQPYSCSHCGSRLTRDSSGQNSQARTA